MVDHPAAPALTRRQLLAGTAAVALAGCGGSRPLLVHAAARLSGVLTPLCAAFPEATVTLNAAPAANLAAELAHGAPADIVWAPDEAWFLDFAALDLIDASSREDWLRDRLALVVRADAPTTLDPTWTLGLPAADVPLGRFADAALARRPALKAHPVKRWPSGAELLTALRAGKVQAALLPVGSVARLSDLRIHERYEDAGIVMPVVLTRRAAPGASRFIEWCRTEKASAFLTSGFTITKS